MEGLTRYGRHHTILLNERQVQAKCQHSIHLEPLDATNATARWLFTALLESDRNESLLNLLAFVQSDPTLQ